MILKFILLLVFAYLFGAIPAAYLVAKWARGIDLRKAGSGNVGFTNLAASVSWRLAVPVLIFDLGKGALVVYVARWFGLSLPLQGLVGIAAIIGHNWPVFLSFNAGRGLLTSIGVALALVPGLAIVLVLLALIGIPFHLLPVTAFICVFLLPVLTWFSDMPVLNWLAGGSLGGERLAMALVFIVLWLVTVVRRLTVPVSPLASTVGRGQLIANRLFLDRDIRDRDAWLQRSSRHTPQEGDKAR
jgi:glycerol-3-phosphate acyltransferase PlsY